MSPMKMFQSAAIFAALVPLAAVASAQGRGATLFADSGYRGWSQRVVVDDPDLGDNQIGTDRASSIRIDRGCRARLYEEINFRGRYVELRGDVSDLGRTDLGNDRTRSVRVRCGWSRNWGDDDRGRGFGDRGGRGDDRRDDRDDRDDHHDARDDRHDDDHDDRGNGRGAGWNPRYGGTPRGSGVTLYRDTGYRGASELVHGDIPDLGRSRIGNDALSSIKLGPGCSVRVWADSEFRGAYLDLRDDAPDFGRTRFGNDRASSLQVRCRPWRGPQAGHGGVTLYRDAGFRGESETFTTEVRDLGRTRVGNDAVSSIEVDPGCSVVLYGDADFRGKSVELWYDVSELGETPVGNDRASSLRVECRH